MTVNRRISTESGQSTIKSVSAYRCTLTKKFNLEVTLTIELLVNQDFSENRLKILLRNDIDGLKTICRKNELSGLYFQKWAEN